MVTVKLVGDDLLYAARVGAGRHIMNRVMQKVEDPKHHPSGSTFDTDIIGAIGEIAVAKYLRAYAPMRTVLKSQDHDVITAEGGVEVRSQRTKEDGPFLVIRKSDAISNPDTPFMLVEVPLGLDEVYIHGWMTPRQAKDRGLGVKSKSGTPAKFIKAGDLNEPATIEEAL